jgi:glycosyltransferase involved in cell wall biosynthesis
VAAADLPVHREICGSAAIYFSRFSPEELADCVSRICDSPELAGNLSSNGLHRSQDFSWHQHVSRLLELAEHLIRVRAEKLN